MEEIIKEHLEHIRSFPKDATIMEICGGHTNVILRYGVREAIPKNIRLISGPGCPVCVSSQKDIDAIIAIASSGVPVATYGDMMRVPGSYKSLEDAKANGAKVFEVYSGEEVLEIRKTHPGVIFFGVGFETTAPMTAYLLKKNVKVYSVHKLIPPALKMLSTGEIAIDGFLDPGHVSTIIGSDPYRRIEKPQAISGFTLEQILRALRFLLKMISEGRSEVINAYPEAVREKGNPVAQDIMAESFKISDSEWRGLGVIEGSGLEVRDDKLNAKKIHSEIIRRVPSPKKTACRCGEILRGKISPSECSLYKKSCTPENPAGACMVSSEGTCAISYRYEK